MSVLDGPGEGTWSVFAMKVMEERDEALAQVARREREHEALLETAQKALARVEAERDEARSETQRLIELNRSHVATLCEAQRNQVEVLKAENERLQRLLDHATQSNPGTSTLVMLMNEASAARSERDLLKNHYSPEVAAKLRAQLASARAEIEMLRGVGCRETKAGEPESGPCGVCLRCAEERGAKWALERHDNPFDSQTLDQYAQEICRYARNK
jgi:hypothetical protein